MQHFDHHPLANHRARIEREIALHELADAVDLDLRDRRRLTLERDDADDAGALEDGQALGRVEAGEAIARKQRPVDLLLAILPPAPLRDRRQECFDVLLLQLLPDDLFVARARPERVPLRRGHYLADCGVAACPACGAPSAP
jgi:hypothetical protein